MDIITTHQLTKRYGRHVGVRDLTLSVPQGSLFGFLGPNGSGKTTTIRLLMGLLKPTAGSARILDTDCARHSHRFKADVGSLPGDLRLYPWLTARTALRIFGQIRGRDLTPAGRDLLDRFKLDPDVRVSSMSRGMRQKLGLILALVHRPRVLILDEPTASLDPLMQQTLCDHLREQATEGYTVFFSSHTLSEVEQLCERIAILRDGDLVADDTLAGLRSRAQRVVTLRWDTDVPSSDIPKESPPFLDLIKRDGNTWHARLKGPVMDLVRWSATQPLEDLSIGQPDLAHLFQQYYTNDQQQQGTHA